MPTMVANLVNDRQLAISINAVQYLGRDCNKGHGNTRYVKNGICIICAKITKAAYNAKIKTHFVCEEYLIAKKNKEIQYIRIKPCIKCNTNLFYTCNRTCINCVSLAKLRSDENEKLASEARICGKTTYTPNRPCKHGHNLKYIESNNCVECGRLTRIKMKDIVKIKRIEALYGLSEEAYWSLVNKQNGSCRLCKTYYKDNFKLHIDHCHTTGKVRGLLCTNCNRGIGHLKHDPSLIREAAIYCEGK